jgi:hypothetical protein
MPPTFILHISDLHRDAGSAISTTTLLESLRLDRERYAAGGLAQSAQSLYYDIELRGSRSLGSDNHLDRWSDKHDGRW